MYIKIDAVDPQAAADNHPLPPGHNGQVYGPLQPPKPRQIVTVPGKVDACTILPQPFAGGRRRGGLSGVGRRRGGLSGVGRRRGGLSGVGRRRGGLSGENTIFTF